MRQRRLLPIAILAILASPAAYGVDFNTALELWNVTESGQAGGRANDKGTSVAIDSTGHYIVAGYLDGAADHGLNAFLAKYDVTGTSVWSQELDSGAVDGVTLLSSTDLYNDLVLDSQDDIFLGGTISGQVSDTYEQAFLVEKRSGVDGSWIWEDVFQDSTGSHVQYAQSVAVNNADLFYATGWSYRAPFIAGQWVSFRYTNNTGARELGPVYNNFMDSVRPDQAHGIAVDQLGNIYVVGEIANTIADGGGLDWQVKKFDPSGLLLWTDTYAGATGQDDVAMAVTTDNLGRAIVVGYTNSGTDGEANQANQWLMIKYEELGDADDLGVRDWEVTWESAPGANERATDLALDGFGDLVVSGTWRDGQYEAWRVASVSAVDGTTTSDWRWSNTGADTEPLGISVDDQTVAVTGYQWNGGDQDLLFAVLDQDQDGDLLGDSLDGCPTDALKTEPGECGCGFEDIDSDGDTFLDCDDACPDLVEKFDDAGICGCDEADVDRDSDGTMDCEDNCPDDPNKDKLGVCGCGTPDDDSDDDGILGCDDACSNTPAGTEVDSHGCPVVETDPGPATSGGDDKDDSGCSTGPTQGGFLALGLAALMIRRRR